MMLRATSILLFVAVVCSLSAWVLAAERSGMNNEKPSIHESDKFGLNFFYAGDKSVKEFLNATPAVSGIWWKFHKEDDEHWYGELHYPTENTGNYDDPDPTRRSDQYYMVFNLAIRKQEGLPIDLKTFRGALVLRDPKPDVPLSTQGDGTSYELVGFQKEKGEGGKYGFLFSQNKDLQYVPPKQ